MKISPISEARDDKHIIMFPLLFASPSVHQRLVLNSFYLTAYNKLFTASFPRELTTGSKLQGQDATLMQMQLVLIRFGNVKDLNITALHTNSQPLPCGAVAQRKDLQVHNRKGKIKNKTG